ncbi:MAG: prepilin-type N-terminal cleavage/methylation domain-containing protein [Candidatus Staskawiczbacteria bacterium]|jgi:prepilin-type N-terminal cleavage/methylation domain-containing protein
MKKYPEGFTIIELIVVIAIIAILSAIVIPNVAGYIQKSQIAGIEAEFDQLIKAGANYYTDPSLGNGDYTNFCSSAAAAYNGSGVGNKIWAQSKYAYVCNSSFGKSWAAYTVLSNSDYYCVDSTGFKQETTASNFGGISTGACATGDTAIESGLSQLQIYAPTYKSNHGNYAGFCNDGTAQTIYNAIVSSNKYCHHNSGNWVACAELDSNQNYAWCVDHSGASKQINNSSCNSVLTSCP